jgi:hypothetical protein
MLQIWSLEHLESITVITSNCSANVYKFSKALYRTTLSELQLEFIHSEI